MASIQNSRTSLGLPAIRRTSGRANCTATRAGCQTVIRRSWPQRSEHMRPGKLASTDRQTGPRATKTAQQLAEDSPQAEVVYTIPSSSRKPAEAIAAAQSAAEAAQQALMTAGPVATAMQSSSLLRSIMEQHSTLQRLYHKAVLPVVKRHGQLSTGGLGLAYSIYCEILQRPCEKCPGDSITVQEVALLAKEVWQLPLVLIDQALADFASCLYSSAGVKEMGPAELFVMKDIVSLLVEGPLDIDAGARDPGKMLRAEGWLGRLASFAAGGLLRADRATYLAAGQELLLAMCQPSSSPPRTAAAYKDGAFMLHLSLPMIYNTAPVITAALQLLPGSDLPAVLQLSAAIDQWVQQGHSSPLATNMYSRLPGAMPGFVATLCFYTYCAGCMCATAYEQLRGERPVDDWQPAQQALESGFGLPYRSMDAWLAVQCLLLRTAAGERISKQRINKEAEPTYPVTETGHYISFGSNYVRIEMCRLAGLGGGSRAIRAEYGGGQLAFVDLLLAGLMEVVDDNYTCWSSAIYWIDVVHLALQQTGGKTGPAAVAAAEQLMKEKHSVFIARLALRLADMQSRSFESQHGADCLMVSCPVSISKEVNNMILARGDRKHAASVAAYLLSGKSLSDQELSGLLARAANSSSGGSTAVNFEQWLSRFLRGEVPLAAHPEQQINTVFAAAQSSSCEDVFLQEHSVDQGIVRAHAAWNSIRCVDALSPPHFDRVADHVWYPAALAQWWIYERSSSRKMAEQLMGPDALRQQYVSPVGGYTASRAVLANQAVRITCQLGWSLSSDAAAALLNSRLIDTATPTEEAVHCVMWLTAAALAADQVSVNTVRRAAIASTIACRKLGTSRLPHSLQMGLVLVDAAVTLLDQDKPEFRPEGVALFYLCVSSVSSFKELAPSVQALLQARMKTLVRNAKSVDVGLFPLRTLAKVPLLHAQDYEQLLQLFLAKQDFGAVTFVWEAAVSAATDRHLSRSAAFGRETPNEAWLAQQLMEVMPQVILHLELCRRGLSDLEHLAALSACCEQLVKQSAAAAVKRLHAAGDSSKPEGWLLLGSVCAVLAAYPLPYEVLSSAAMDVLDVLLKQQLQVAVPSLPAVLCAASAAGAARGDLTTHQTALQHAKSLGLSATDVAKIRSAALCGAADAVRVCTHTAGATDVLLQLWSDALAAATVEGADLLQPRATSSLVSVMAGDNTLASQLLKQPLPGILLTALMRAAQDHQAGSVAGQLLQHAEDHDLLQQLPPEVLAAAMRLSTACAAEQSESGAVTGAPNRQLIAVLLQQGQVPDATTAASLVNATMHNADQWQDLLAWLQQQCSTSPPETVHEFLYRVLEASSSSATADQSWQMYELLQQVAKQPCLSPQLCSSVLQQHCNTADRVLRIWHDSRVITSAELLSNQAQAILLSALTAAGQQDEAVELMQQVPAQLSQLAALWQQHVEDLNSSHVQKALQLAVQQDTAESAAAAEQLLQVLQQHMTDQETGLQLTAVPLVQLFSRHRQLTAAGAVLSEYVLSTAAPDTAAPAVVHYLSAAASEPSRHGAAVELFGSRDSSESQEYLLAAFKQLMSKPGAAPEAVALLLHVMERSTGQQQLPKLLEAALLEQLCAFICLQHTSSTKGSGLAGSSPAAGLPTPQQLAVQCLQSGVLIPASVTALLVNSLAASAPGLQPAAAAVALGVVPQAQLAALNADSRSRQAEAPQSLADSTQHEEVEQSSKVIAHLCYKQLLSSIDSSSAQDIDELSSTTSTWVSQLSTGAAAAALFAAWHWQELATAAGIPQQAVGVLCLELYQAARSGGKPSLDSLLLDMGLAAAAAAQHWEKGLNIIHSAEVVLSSTVAGGSKRGVGPSSWVPVLPAALTALPAVLNYTQGVHKTADRFMRECEQLQEQQVTPQTASRSKGQPAPAAAGSSLGHGLLSLSCINSFLSSAVCVAQYCAADGDDDAARQAAQAALRVANALFAKQLIQKQLAAAASNAVSRNATEAAVTTSDQLQPDAVTYSCLLQLYGLTGQYQWVSDITLAAVRHELGLVDSSSDSLQEVLAGSAAAWLHAGAADVVFVLLDGAIAAGVTHINNPEMIDRLLEAAMRADNAEQALSSRLVGGVEVAEVFMLCENHHEVLKEVPTLQVPDTAASTIEGVRLVATASLNWHSLHQHLQRALQRAADGPH